MGAASRSLSAISLATREKSEAPQMPLTLEQYADSLDQRRDLQWPAPPDPEAVRAKPHLKKLTGIRAVTWSVYGTLLSITYGELQIDHPVPFVMEVALDKTIQEFKMWKSMTRKPGKPADVLLLWYRGALDEMKLQTLPGERYPEFASHKIWEAIVKKLMTNEYTYLASHYGDLEAYSQKIAYFFHGNLQGTRCHEGAARTLYHLHSTLGKQGLLADGQCFTWTQLKRGLRAQEPSMEFDAMLPATAHTLSFAERARKPSDRLFKAALAHFAKDGLPPEAILHVGSHLHHDVVPARKHGMRTALFAGDKHSLRATTEELKNKGLRPDVLITELPQLRDVVA
jgi:hypothetical protein